MNTPFFYFFSQASSSKRTSSLRSRSFCFGLRRSERPTQTSWDSRFAVGWLARSPSSALSYPFLGEGSPAKIDDRKKGALILTSPLEDRVCHPLIGGTKSEAPTCRWETACVPPTRSLFRLLLWGSGSKMGAKSRALSEVTAAWWLTKWLGCLGEWHVRMQQKDLFKARWDKCWTCSWL